MWGGSGEAGWKRGCNMLSVETIHQFAVKWQTTPLNVAREYLQHLFLSQLYRQKESDFLAFKGGTALRLVFQSPRFSEDLDFSGSVKPFHLEKLLTRTLEELRREAVSLTVEESKTTSGGYLAHYTGQVHGMAVHIELNISLRSKAATEPMLIATPLVPSYQCLILPVEKLVAEKMQALLTRKKPRDFFDLYFLLRGRIGVPSIIPLRTKLLKEVEGLDAKALQRELKIFLPVSHQQVAARLPSALSAELGRL